jgi:hypothetical protein
MWVGQVASLLAKIQNTYGTRISLCLDPLLKSDFADFYAYNAFLKKSGMFG